MGSSRCSAAFKGVVYLALCSVPLVSSLFLGVSSVTLATYGIGSFLAFLLSWCDKCKARSGQWRISENTLHTVELLGGWPGALLAQQLFHHKTRKSSYRIAFWAIVLVHESFWVFLLKRV
ncbi:putative membrane protein [Paratrimastix pyriformis]|uniref:Membrane protein n=1 Tax=Paratrimastix pyriformis TaxID=342808 RepID=A0ABQ8U5N8_9EUKA|nr:putative membrane protein [Paratrimastix pyriformis]